MCLLKCRLFILTSLSMSNRGRSQKQTLAWEEDTGEDLKEQGSPDP